MITESFVVTINTKASIPPFPPARSWKFEGYNMLPLSGLETEASWTWCDVHKSLQPKPYLDGI